MTYPSLNLGTSLVKLLRNFYYGSYIRCHSPKKDKESKVPHIKKERNKKRKKKKKQKRKEGAPYVRAIASEKRRTSFQEH